MIFHVYSKIRKFVKKQWILNIGINKISLKKEVMVKNTEGSLRMTIIFTFNGHWEL